MSVPALLDPEAIASFLASHPGWALEGGSIVRRYAFSAYADGVAFVVRAAFFAEKMNHHPDLKLGYRTVEVSATTWDAGGLTALDTAFAAQCDALHRG